MQCILQVYTVYKGMFSVHVCSRTLTFETGTGFQRRGVLDHLGPPGDDVETGVSLKVQDPFWVQVLKWLLQSHSEQNRVT